jgi:hypothetical protein
MTALRPPADRALSPRTRRHAVQLGLGLLASALATLLAWAPKPWITGVGERLRQGSNVRISDYVLTYGWWAALANLALVVLLLATTRRWLGSAADAPRVAALAPPPVQRAAAVLALAAVVTCGTLAWPRLGQSLWDDEVYNLRRSISGYWKVEDGELHFKHATWLDSLWYYRMPNNHVPHTLAARASLTAWRELADAPGEQFDERALRLPAFAAGLGTLGAVAWLLLRLGLPAAGAWAAWLLALHPWLLRYASEARGYSLVLLLATLLPALLLRALEWGTWRRWGAFATAEVLLLWNYPAVAQLLLLTNIVALWALATLHRGSPFLRPQLTRWLVANLCAAGAWLQLMAPNLAQLSRYVGEDKARSGLSQRWFRDFSSLLSTGMPWKRSAAPGSPYPQLSELADRFPEVLAVSATIALLGVAAGTVRLARSAGPRRWLAPLLLLPGPLTALVAWAQDLYLWEWYLIFMLPGWAALLAVGLSWPLEVARRPASRWAIGGALLALLAGFSLLVAPARQALRDRSLQPRRESVELTGRPLDPTSRTADRVLTASFHIPPDLYDPRVVDVRKTPDLLALMRQADREQRPLYVNIGWRELAGKRRSELLGIVERPQLFELVALLHGFEPRLSRHVYRYVGAEPR